MANRRIIIVSGFLASIFTLWFLLVSVKKTVRIRTDVVADRVSFVAGDSDKIRGEPLMLNFDSLAIHNFSGINMEPESLGFGESIGDSAKAGGQVKILSNRGRLHSSVTIRPSESGKGSRPIIQINFSRPHTKVNMEVTSHNKEKSKMGILISIEGENPFAELRLSGKYSLIAGHSHIPGLTQPKGSNTTSFHAVFSEKNPKVTIKGKSRYLALNVTLSTKSNPFDGLAIPLEKIEFVRQNQNGDIESTVKKDGAIQFPDHRKIPGKNYMAGSFVVLDKLKKDFGLHKINPDTENGAMRMLIAGTAETVKIKQPPSEALKDFRPSHYEVIDEHLKIIAFIVSFFAGIYGFAEKLVGKGKNEKK